MPSSSDEDDTSTDDNLFEAPVVVGDWDEDCSETEIYSISSYTQPTRRYNFLRPPWTNNKFKSYKDCILLTVYTQLMFYIKKIF